MQTLDRDRARFADPKTIRVDDGSEFVFRDHDFRACASNLAPDFARAGKPTDNGLTEAFNQKLKAECLAAHWFMSRANAIPSPPS